MIRHVREALADALLLVLPLWCAGCDTVDENLCATCADAVRPQPARQDLAGLTVWSALTFDGVVGRVVRALKEDGRTPLARELAPALRAAVDSAGFGRGIVVVPIPTSRAAFRRRGFRVVDTIARHAGVPLRPLLSVARRAVDQRGLGVQARRRNVAGALRARDAEGLRVIIIDDVVTTGATLHEAARALRAAGAVVAGAATVAATPRRVSGSTGGPVTSETHR